MFLQRILNKNKKFYNTVEKCGKMERHKSTSRKLQQEETERERKPSHRTNTWRWYWKEICCFQLLLPWQPQLTGPPTQWLACNESSVLKVRQHSQMHTFVHAKTHTQAMAQTCTPPCSPLIPDWLSENACLPLTEVESGEKKNTLVYIKRIVFQMLPVERGEEWIVDSKAIHTPLLINVQLWLLVSSHTWILWAYVCRNMLVRQAIILWYSQACWSGKRKQKNKMIKSYCDNSQLKIEEVLGLCFIGKMLAYECKKWMKCFGRSLQTEKSFTFRTC